MQRRDPRGTGPGLGPGWDRGRDRGWDGSGSGSRCPRGLQSPRSAVCTVPNITTHGWTVYPPSRPVSPVPPRVPAQHHRPVFVPSPRIKKISRPREKPPLRSRRGLGQNRDPPESPPGSERKETQRNRLIAWFNSIFPPQFWVVQPNVHLRERRKARGDKRNLRVEGPGRVRGVGHSEFSGFCCPRYRKSPSGAAPGWSLARGGRDSPPVAIEPRGNKPPVPPPPRE